MTAPIFDHLTDDEFLDVREAVKAAVAGAADESDDPWGHPAANAAVAATSRAGMVWEFVSWGDTLALLDAS